MRTVPCFFIMSMWVSCIQMGKELQSSWECLCFQHIKYLFLFRFCSEDYPVNYFPVFLALHWLFLTKKFRKVTSSQCCKHKKVFVEGRSFAVALMAYTLLVQHIGKKWTNAEMGCHWWLLLAAGSSVPEIRVSAIPPACRSLTATW